MRRGAGRSPHADDASAVEVSVDNTEATEDAIEIVDVEVDAVVDVEDVEEVDVQPRSSYSFSSSSAAAAWRSARTPSARDDHESAAVYFRRPTCTLQDDWYSAGSWILAANHSSKFRCPATSKAHLQHLVRYGVDYSSHTSAMVECGRPIAAEYRWAPSRCRLAELNATKLDLMLAGRRVFVIGDSLGMQTWASLACVLSAHVNAEATRRTNDQLWKSGFVLPDCAKVPPPTGATPELCGNYSAFAARLEREQDEHNRAMQNFGGGGGGSGGGGGKRPPPPPPPPAGAFALKSGGSVELLFSDYLIGDWTDQHDTASTGGGGSSSTSSNANGGEFVPMHPSWSTDGHRRLQTAWAARLLQASGKLRPDDIVILNAGAHHPDLDLYKRTMLTALDWLRRNFHGSLLFTDFYPGLTANPSKHCICHPFNRVAESNKFFPSGSPARLATCTRQYNWGASAAMNRHVSELISTMPGLRERTHIMRVSPMMTQRCDRKDPLHFCMPGATSEWAVLLYNWLLLTPRRQAQPQAAQQQQRPPIPKPKPALGPSWSSGAAKPVSASPNWREKVEALRKRFPARPGMRGFG